MEFWHIFDIFHWLRPYLCSKRHDLGFYKQATHRRPGDEPFFHYRAVLPPSLSVLYCIAIWHGGDVLIEEVSVKVEQNLFLSLEDPPEEEVEE